MKEVRPWGFYRTLEESDNYKVKYIWVDPNQKLSYQRHKHRAEHWMIISGNPVVILNGLELNLKPGASLNIAKGSLHRIMAGDEPVEFIEVQTGDYFGEDDIERLEDDYGR